MVKIMRFRLVLLAAFCVFCAVPMGIAVESGLYWLVSPELLSAGKLQTLWQNKLPLKRGESLRDLHILGGRIYALSSRNYMVSLNREKGNVIFSRAVAEAGFPVLGLELYRDELFSISGNKLVQMDPDFGTERSVRRLTFGIVCPAGRNSSYFYVAGSDRRMHVLRSEDKVQVFEAAAEDDSLITSIIADDNFVIFATNTGVCISITPDRPKRLWQFNAAGGIVGPIVKDENSLFLTSEDTNVYKLNILTGKLVWRYQIGAVPEKGPRVSERVAYQYACNDGLTAIDKKSGSPLWHLAEGVGLLAEADGKAYVIANGELVVMDNKKGKRLYSVNFAQVSRYAANVTDSRIYIADKAGRIACLKPIE